MVELGEVCDLMTGGTPKSDVNEYYENGTIKWLVSGDIHKGEIFDCNGRITELGMKESNARILPLNSVLIALNGQGKTRGTVAILRTEATCNQSLVAISPKDKSQLVTEYLFYILKSKYEEIRTITGDNQRSGLNMHIIRQIEIPLPPLEIQQEIVVELENYQRVIDGARQVVENYKPTFEVDPEWETVELGEVADLSTGTTPSTDRADYYVGSHAFVKTAEINNQVIRKASTFISDSAVKDYNLKTLPRGTILMAMYGQGKTRGQVALLEIPASITQNAAAIQTKRPVAFFISKEKGRFCPLERDLQ